jgi:hypothetical protein
MGRGLAACFANAPQTRWALCEPKTPVRPILQAASGIHGTA